MSKRLRWLSLNHCGLTSFQGMPWFPELRSLSAAYNKLASYSGLPAFPRLVSVDLSHNPIDFSPELTLLAIGSVNLETFNGEPITEQQLRTAFELSPLVGYSLRRGRDPTPQADPASEIEATQRFLTSPLRTFLGDSALTENLTLTERGTGETATLTCPFQSVNIKWYRNLLLPVAHSPIRLEWQHIRRPPSDPQPANILPLSRYNVHLHLVRCDFELGGRVFSLYTDYPIGQLAHNLSLPIPIDPEIRGTPIETALISLIPLAVPTRLSWSTELGEFATDRSHVSLTADQVGHHVSCQVEPYVPRHPSVSFAVMSLHSDVPVAPLLPTVTEVAFPDTIVEDLPIKFSARVMPAAEGQSEVYVEAATSPSAEWTRLAELEPGRLRYTPTAEDVGLFLRVAYTPVTEKGVRGDTVLSYAADRVKPALPRLLNPLIGGIPKANSPLAAVAGYAGGRRGSTFCTWYLSPAPITDVSAATVVASDTQVWTPGPEHAGGYVAVEMLPIRCDGVVGESVLASIRNPLGTLDPPAPLAVDPQKPVTGRTMTAGALVSWEVSDPAGHSGFTEVRRGKTFTPRAKHAGRLLRVMNDVSDVILGEIKLAPPVIDFVNIDLKKAVVGERAEAVIEPALRRDQFEVVWLKVQNGCARAVAWGSLVYELDVPDIGFQLRAQVTTLDADGRRVKTTESGATPVVQEAVHAAPSIDGSLVEESPLVLRYYAEPDDVAWFRSDAGGRWAAIGETGARYVARRADVGRFLRVEFRVGAARLFAVSSGAVRPLPPLAFVEPGPALAAEGSTLAPAIRYVGGREGKSAAVWRRTSEDGAVREVSRDRVYKVTFDDIGSRLEFAFTPVRSDGAAGQTVAVSYGIVAPGPPSVVNVRVQQNARGNLECAGAYSGGVEGDSVFEWFVDGSSFGTTTERELAPPADLFGAMVEVSYRPVRRDGASGRAVHSANKLLVKPIAAVLSLEIVATTGRVEVGAPLRCRAETEHATAARFRWAASADGEHWVALEGARGADYVPAPADIGKFLRCTAEAVGEFRGAPVSEALRDPVGHARERLKIVADNFWAGTMLRTNIDRPVSWEREDANGTFGVVAEGETYLVTVNDVGCRLAASLGPFETEVSPQCALRPPLESFAKSLVRTKRFEFIGRPKAGKLQWNASLDKSGFRLSRKGAADRVGDWKRVRAEAVEGTSDEMRVSFDESAKFRMVPQLLPDSVLRKQIGASVRDFVVAVIRGFCDGAQA
jgi:hypothetical protein